MRSRDFGLINVEVFVKDGSFDWGAFRDGFLYGFFFQKRFIFDARQDSFLVSDAGRGYRRVVASPRPREIVEAPAIESLLSQGSSKF